MPEGPIPATWISSYDASDPDHGIHCRSLTDLGAIGKAGQALRLMLKLAETFPIP